LLQADLHCLFDLGLLSVDPDRLTVLLAPSVAASSYASLVGAELLLPDAEALRPNREALRLHSLWSGL
jgi:hypothetical protein